MSKNPPRYHHDYDSLCADRWVPAAATQREAELALDNFRAMRAQREEEERLAAALPVGHIVHPVDGAERAIVESMFGDFDSTFPEHVEPIEQARPGASGQ